MSCLPHRVFTASTQLSDFNVLSTNRTGSAWNQVRQSLDFNVLSTTPGLHSIHRVSCQILMSCLPHRVFTASTQLSDFNVLSTNCIGSAWNQFKIHWFLMSCHPHTLHTIHLVSCQILMSCLPAAMGQQRIHLVSCWSRSSQSKCLLKHVFQTQFQHPYCFSFLMRLFLCSPPL